MSIFQKGLGIVFLAVFLSFPAFAATEALAANKERLVIGISQFPATLSPVFESMLAKTYVLSMARRPITAYDSDWAQICLMCVRLPRLQDGTAVEETTQNGNPGLAVRYTLPAEAVWGDGTPMTTKDVAFTFKVGKTPEIGTLNAELFRRIDHIDLVDDKSFVLHLNKRTCDYSDLSGFALLPAHLEEALFDQAPEEYQKRTLYDTDPSRPGLWFGPYRIADVEQGQTILLERNPAWWGKAPYFDEILIRTIENTATMGANLLSGDIDMIAGELGLNIDQAIAFEKRHGGKFQFLYRSGLIYEHIDVNLSNPILSDIRVRKALLHAMNRDALSDRLFQGRQPVAHGNVNPLDKWYDPDVPKTEYNPEKAKALLEDAGWVPGEDGVRVKDGVRLSILFQTTAGNKTRELVQQVLQDQWRKIGIEVKIDNEQARIFFSETVAKRKFEGLAMYAWLSAPESVPRTTLHSQDIPSAETGWSGQNYPGYASPDMDRILDRLETDCAETVQRDLWSGLQGLYAEDLPVLPLYFRANAHILPEQMTGVFPTGHQFPSSLWVENWSLSGTR